MSTNPSDIPISASDVKKLRDETGAGMMDCKRALSESKGDVTAAKDLLRTWGLAGVEKRKARTASDGLVVSYLHEVGGLPPKVGVLLELDTETDFVAKTPDIRQLCPQPGHARRGHGAALGVARRRSRGLPRERAQDRRGLRRGRPQAREHPGEDHRGQGVLGPLRQRAACSSSSPT